MINLDFLIKCHSNIYCYLNQLFQTERKYCVCFTVFNQYHYICKNWFDGKEYHVSLSDANKHKEKYKVDKIKYKDFKIESTKLNC